jgi:hypothetical protein
LTIIIPAAPDDSDFIELHLVQPALKPFERS